MTPTAAPTLSVSVQWVPPDLEGTEPDSALAQARRYRRHAILVTPLTRCDIAVCPGKAFAVSHYPYWPPVSSWNVGFGQAELSARIDIHRQGGEVLAPVPGTDLVSGEVGDWSFLRAAARQDGLSLTYMAAARRGLRGIFTAVALENASDKPMKGLLHKWTWPVSPNWDAHGIRGATGELVPLAVPSKVDWTTVLAGSGDARAAGRAIRERVDLSSWFAQSTEVFVQFSTREGAHARATLRSATFTAVVGGTPVRLSIYPGTSVEQKQFCLDRGSQLFPGEGRSVRGGQSWVYVFRADRRSDAAVEIDAQGPILVALATTSPVIHADDLAGAYVFSTAMNVGFAFLPLEGSVLSGSFAHGQAEVVVRAQIDALNPGDRQVRAYWMWPLESQTDGIPLFPQVDADSLFAAPASPAEAQWTQPLTQVVTMYTVYEELIRTTNRFRGVVVDVRRVAAEPDAGERVGQALAALRQKGRQFNHVILDVRGVEARLTGELLQSWAARAAGEGFPLCHVRVERDALEPLGATLPRVPSGEEIAGFAILESAPFCAGGTIEPASFTARFRESVVEATPPLLIRHKAETRLPEWVRLLSAARRQVFVFGQPQSLAAYAGNPKSWDHATFSEMGRLRTLVPVLAFHTLDHAQLEHVGELLFLSGYRQYGAAIDPSLYRRPSDVFAAVQSARRSGARYVILDTVEIWNPDVTIAPWVEDAFDLAAINNFPHRDEREFIFHDDLATVVRECQRLPLALVEAATDAKIAELAAALSPYCSAGIVTAATISEAPAESLVLVCGHSPDCLPERMTVMRLPRGSVVLYGRERRLALSWHGAEARARGEELLRRLYALGKTEQEIGQP